MSQASGWSCSSTWASALWIEMSPLIVEKW